MGLRTASVRRQSSVVTMAPALTETKSTSNTFKLTPKNQATVAGVVEAALEDGVAAATTQTAAIVRKGVKPDSEELFDLAHLQLAAELLTKGDFTLERCKLSPSDNGIMNNTDEDDPIIQNPTITTTTTNEEMVQPLDPPPQPIKDEAIVDQMFANLPSDDDLMQQVIKSIESSVCTATEEEDLPLSASDLATLPGNLSSLFNAVDMMGIEQLMVGATEPQIEQTVDKKDLRTTELMQQVQVKQVRLERKLDFLQRRLRKMQLRHMGQHFSAEVAGVYEHVHRTLRRLKGENQPSTSAACDVSGTAALDLSVAAQSAAHALELGVGEKDGEVLKPISHSAAKSLVKKLENTRYLQANSASRQRLSARFFGSGSIEPTPFRPTAASSTSSSATPSSLTLIPTWPAADKASLQQTASQLRTQMSLLQGQLDSDATASSSGGESCDEMTVYGNVHQQYLAIQKRAAWKYNSARASIAARWSWLLAQIADLEYRIKQHNDLQRTIRTKKGPVILSSAIPPNITASTASNPAVNGYKGTLPGGGDSNKDSDASCARIRPLNAATFVKRRLVQTGGLHLVSKKAARPATVRCACVADDVTGGGWRGMNCAVCTGRSDPTLPRDPTEHLSRMERIALLDGGYHPVVSLPEDTSISVHMEAIMKSVDWQQRSSRSSLKAMKYAIKADRLNSEQRGDKQQQSGGSGDRERPVSSKKGGAGVEHRKKYNRLPGAIKGSTVNALTAKLKSGRPRGRKPNSARLNNNNSLHAPTTHKKHHHRRNSSQIQRSRERSTSHNNSNDDMDLDDHYMSEYLGRDRDECGLGPGSRSGSPLLATQSISGFGRRNRVDSYDIDNIVIPYSVAASTRVERLQYKEILTPKWRLVDDSNLPPIKYESKNNGIVKITSQENEVSDVEDISEDAVLQRHDKSEQEEKRKFLSYLKLPFGYYSAPSHRRHLQALHHHHNNNNNSTHRRTDSRAESSGANTPDNPMSPANVTAVPTHQVTEGGTETSVASPPPLIDSKGEELPESLRNLPLSSLSSLRRRTISSSSARWHQREPSVSEGDLPPQAPIVEVAPYERKQFPLSAENYDKMLRGMPEGHHTSSSVNTGKQLTMNVRHQDDVASPTSTPQTSTPINPNRASSSSSMSTPVDSHLNTRERRSTTATASTSIATPTHHHHHFHHHQQLIGSQSTSSCHTDDHRTSRSALDDIDSESTESAFGDEDPNDPEWDLDDQITRNSHEGGGGGLGGGRFRR